MGSAGHSIRSVGRGRGTKLACRGRLALTLLLSVAPALAIAETADDAPSSRFGVSTGVDFSSGDYGDSVDTTMWYVPFTLRWERGPWSARVTIPFLSIHGPGNVVGGVDGGEVIGSSTSMTRTTESGLGDVVLTAAYSIEPWISEMPWIDLVGKIKFPTASDERSLGTGEFDYSIQLDLARSFGRFTPLGTIGYRFVGDPPDAHLANTIFTSIGGAWRFDAAWSAGMTYDWRQTASRTGSSHELSPYLTWKIRPDLSLTPYAVVGLSRKAPDYGLGFQTTYWH